MSDRLPLASPAYVKNRARALIQHGQSKVLVLRARPRWTGSERDIAIDNLLGSSVFNLFLILGVTAMVPRGGIGVEHDLMRIDLPVMLAVAVLCVPVFFSGRRVSRWEGIGFVALYAGYLTYLVAART